MSLAEAHLTLLTLPYGTQLKMGKMRNRFGLLNQRHAHDLAPDGSAERAGPLSSAKRA